MYKIKRISPSNLKVFFTTLNINRIFLFYILIYSFLTSTQIYYALKDLLWLPNVLGLRLNLGAGKGINFNPLFHFVSV